jgi:uncharacterized coiled-coil DUF342 family protein
MTISDSGAELAFKILSTLIIPLAVYILNMDSSITSISTKIITIEERLQEERQRTNYLSTKSEENEKEIREIKVSLDYMKKDLAEIKSDIKLLIQQGKRPND